MPGTPATTPRLALPRFATTDPDQVPIDLNAVSDRLDVVTGRFESGLLAARPSTGPGIADRFYFATDDTSGGPAGTLYRDAGGASPTWQRIEPANMEAAFSTWKTVARGGGQVTSAMAAGTYVLWAGATADASRAQALVGAASTAPAGFWLDPADWTAGSRTTKLRIRARCLVNSIAPGASFTIGLCPVATFGGTAPAAPFIATVSAAVSGSAVAFPTPGASSHNVFFSSEFTAPVAGTYVLVNTVSALTATNSVSALEVHLQMRQV